MQREEQGRNERKLDLVAKMADESECRTNVDVKMMGGLVGWFETFPGEKPLLCISERRNTLFAPYYCYHFAAHCIFLDISHLQSWTKVS